MKIAGLLDVTLRDGALGLHFPYSMKQTIGYVEILRNLGVRNAEVGFVHGPGALDADIIDNPNFHADRSVIENINARIPDVDLCVMADGNNGRLRQPGTSLFVASPAMIRVTVASPDFEDHTWIFDGLRDSGTRFSVNLKHSGLYRVEDLLRAAKLAEDVGAECIYIVDTSGTMTPDAVSVAISTIRDAVPSVLLGFHGHNNLGLAVGNSLAAVESGVDLVDVSLGGVGAGGGNTPLEVMLFLCEDAGPELMDELAPAYELLAPHIDPALAQTAFWGRIGASSESRAALQRLSQKYEEPLRSIAWEWRFGSEIRRTNHSLVERRIDLKAGRFVRKYGLSSIEGFGNEIEFALKANSKVASICSVLEHGSTADGTPYYDLPYLDGESLRELRLADEENGDISIVPVQRLMLALRELWSAWPVDIEPEAHVVKAQHKRLEARLSLPKYGGSETLPDLGWTSADQLDPEELLSMFRYLPTVQIAGVENRGVDELLQVLDDPFLIPPISSLGIIHGDPHFGNIMFSDGVWLLDNGGFLEGGDIAYDIAKVLLSLDGCDPLMHKALKPFQFRRRDGLVEVADIEWSQQGPRATLRAEYRRRILKEAVLPPLVEFVEADENLFPRAEMIEALHLLALAPTMTYLGWVGAAQLLQGISLLNSAVAQYASQVWR